MYDCSKVLLRMQLAFGMFWPHWECQADFYTDIGTGKVISNSIFIILVITDDVKEIK